MTWERLTFVFTSVWSQGITSRPLFNWMPTPGPVAYHVHFRSFTDFVRSTGFDHVRPSSLLFVTHTRRVPLLVPARMARSLSLPRLWVSSSQMVPVERSTTGQGLPTVLAPSSAITCRRDQVLPPSALRLSTTSM